MESVRTTIDKFKIFSNTKMVESIFRTVILNISAYTASQSARDIPFRERKKKEAYAI